MSTSPKLDRGDKRILSLPYLKRRYHRSMKNLILLDNYCAPAELTERIREWADYYNHHRYHEAIDNVTPVEKHFGMGRVILKKREKVRKETVEMRSKWNRIAMLEVLPNGVT